MRKKSWLILAVILLTGALISATWPLKTPLPSDINIIPPDPSLPLEIRALSGGWTGSWNSMRGWDCVLIVEKVNQDSAQVIYSWGEYITRKSSCHCTPNWTRVMRGSIDYTEGKANIYFKTPNLQVLQERDSPPYTVQGLKGKYSFSFTLEKNKPDILQGRFLSGKSSQLYVEMKRIN